MIIAVACRKPVTILQSIVILCSITIRSKSRIIDKMKKI